ncbi:hypothetical protein QQP08_000289 [Theobroma cacao]|nr:hypothetical protein QQP08_000289 [Theobroma cacao]
MLALQEQLPNQLTNQTGNLVGSPRLNIDKTRTGG